MTRKQAFKSERIYYFTTVMFTRAHTSSFLLSTVNQHPSSCLQMAELTDLASRWKESVEMPNKYLTAMCVMSNQRLAAIHVMSLATNTLSLHSSYCDLLTNMFPKTDMERRLCHEIFHSVFAGYNRECYLFVCFVRIAPSHFRHTVQLRPTAACPLGPNTSWRRTRSSNTSSTRSNWSHPDRAIVNDTTPHLKQTPFSGL